MKTFFDVGANDGLDSLKYARNNPRLNDKESISFYMCTIRQQKADDLIFEILKRHSAEWWD